MFFLHIVRPQPGWVQNSFWISPIWVFTSIIEDGWPLVINSISCMLKTLMLSCLNDLTIMRIMKIQNIPYSHPSWSWYFSLLFKWNFEKRIAFSTFAGSRGRWLHVEGDIVFVNHPITRRSVTLFAPNCSSRYLEDPHETESGLKNDICLLSAVFC